MSAKLEHPHKQTHWMAQSAGNEFNLGLNDGCVQTGMSHSGRSSTGNRVCDRKVWSSLKRRERPPRTGNCERSQNRRGGLGIKPLGLQGGSSCLLNVPLMADLAAHHNLKSIALQLLIHVFYWGPVRPRRERAGSPPRRPRSGSAGRPQRAAGVRPSVPRKRLSRECGSVRKKSSLAAGLSGLSQNNPSSFCATLCLRQHGCHIFPLTLKLQVFYWQPFNSPL